MPYRAALIGCGKIGSEFADDHLIKRDVFTHAEAYTVCPETTLVAICDTDPHRLVNCGQRWGVDSRYQSVLTMMDIERPNLVSICTPDDSHYQILSQVLTSDHKPLGVLCEKPLATDLVQARELVNMCKYNGVALAVNYMRRFAENVNSLRSYILDGNLGEIQAVNGWYTKGVIHNGSHWFDLLRFLVGEVDWVLGVNTLKEMGPDPTIDVLLGLHNGALASLRALSAVNFTIFDMEIMGAKGRVQLTDSCFRIDLSLAAQSPRYSGYVELSPIKYHFGNRKNLMLHAVENLVRCLETGDRPACSGEDGLAALEISWAACQSAHDGEKKILHG